MGQALYRKYRSKSLSEIVGQDHITQTLTRALKQGRISHAYLFTGPRGVGKTSIARILAHEINSLEYSSHPHLDIIEIDAASNRRIDEIRELRDKVYIAPTSAKYKVYIIDEVHMLTREAFNALLKTLEEPPEHAVFILATTDAHKLPETIVSRTQRFTFKPVPVEAVVAHLKQIAKTENINASDDALKLLAEHGEGSFRDSISMLDQASSHGDKIDAETVRSLLGIPPAELVSKLLDDVSSGTSAELAFNLNMLYEQGYHAALIAKQLSQQLRTQVLSGALPFDSKVVFGLLNRLLKVPMSSSPDLSLEIVLLEARNSVQPLNIKDASKPLAPKQADEGVAIIPEVAVKQETKPIPAEPPKATNKTKDRPEAVVINSEEWQQVMDVLKQRHNTLYGVVRMADAEFNDDGSLNLYFSFAFHQKRINESANQKALSDIIHDTTGRSVVINCIFDKDRPKKTAALPNQNSVAVESTEDLSAISNIFGGGELIESEQ